MSYLLYWFLAEDVETVPQSELTYQTWGPWSNSWWVVGAGGILHIKQNRHQTFTNNTKYYWMGLSSFPSQKNQSEKQMSHKTPNTFEQNSHFRPAIYLCGRIPPLTEFPYWACLLGLPWAISWWGFWQADLLLKERGTHSFLSSCMCLWDMMFRMEVCPRVKCTY